MRAPQFNSRAYALAQRRALAYRAGLQAGLIAQYDAREPMRTYHVYIDKAYFPRNLWPGGVQNMFGQWHVKARSRTEAAQAVWAAYGPRLLAMMTPHEGRMPRRVSLHVDSHDAPGNSGLANRLAPVRVYAAAERPETPSVASGAGGGDQCGHRAAGTPHIGPVAFLGGITVCLVDGAWVRNHLEPDFCLGGHDLAYPSLIPAGQIWLERPANAGPKAVNDMVGTLLHEIAERTMMLHQMSYERAHKAALACETRVRAALSSGAGEFAAEDRQAWARQQMDRLAQIARQRGLAAERDDSASTRSLYLYVGVKNEAGGLTTLLAVRASDHSTPMHKTGRVVVNGTPWHNVIWSDAKGRVEAAFGRAETEIVGLANKGRP